MSTVGLVAFLWFAVGLGSLLRTVEPGLPWRAGVVPASAGVVVTLGLVGDWDAAAYRATDLDPQIARFAFDMGNRSFANGWVALGGLAVCAGWVVASTTWLPHWLGWWAVVSGVGLALCRIWWTSSIWVLPHPLFWLWVITVSVLLLRRPLPAGLDGR